MKTAERNKLVIRTLLEATDEGAFELVRKCYHVSFVEHNPHSAVHIYEGSRGVEQAFRIFDNLFPTRKHVIDDIIAEGDKVAARITFIAKGSERLFPIHLQNQEFKITSTAMYRLQDFQIIEKWTQVSVLKELGISLKDMKHLEL